MNFYIGNSVNEIDVRDENIEFSEDLIEYIYNLQNKTPFCMKKLYEIDLYADVEIAETDVKNIIDICNYILSHSLLADYKEKDEGTCMLLNLIDIANKALEKQLGLVSVGD